MRVLVNGHAYGLRASKQARQTYWSELTSTTLHRRITLYQSLLVNENEYCEIYESGLAMSLDLYVTVS